MKAVKLFIIDDHPVFLDGLRNSFDKEKDGVFVGSWSKSIADAREKMKRSSAAVIFLDLVLPGESGVDYCKELKTKYPEKKVIILTGESDSTVLHTVWMNGADAILSKFSDKNQLLEVIGDVMKSKRVIGKDVPHFFDIQTKPDMLPFLSLRERQVMYLLSAAYTRKEAAAKLFVSLDTVNKHCTNVFKKYGVNKLSEYMELVKRLNAKR